MKLTSCMRKRTFAFFFSVLSLPALADIPANYYSSANGTSSANDALRIALYTIINNHTVISYSNLLSTVYAATTNPSDFNNGVNKTLEDIYSSVPYTESQGGSSASDCGQGWNKEHTVPQSWFGGASPMYSDAFHIYPTVVCNPKRQHDRQKTNRKMKDKMPTLQQNQKSCIPTLKANAMQHICFCPNAPSDINHGLTTITDI